MEEEETYHVKLNHSPLQIGYVFLLFRYHSLDDDFLQGQFSLSLVTLYQGEAPSLKMDLYRVRPLRQQASEGDDKPLQRYSLASGPLYQ